MTNHKEEAMTDEQAMTLLRLLHQYVIEYPDGAGGRDLSVMEVAEDLARSMDEHSTEAQQLRTEIHGAMYPRAEA